MTDPPSLHPPPTQTTPGRSNSNLSMIYYGMVVVGTAAIILALYNLLIVKFCLEFTENSSQQRARGRSQGGPSDNFVSSFKYKRERRAIDEDGESECAVCLSVYEEDEELKQLPRCKHCFHAPCIDMWLYSHMDCPLCRTPVVEPPVLHGVPFQRHDVAGQEGFLGSPYLV